MEQRLSLVTCAVADLDRSVAFYEALGWSRAMRQAEGVAFFQCGGIGFALYPADALSRDLGGHPLGVGMGRVTLAYNTRSEAEVDTVLSEAAAAGAEIVKPAEAMFWGGYAGYFADPDGHLWEVAWNPGFPLDDAGAISLPE